MVNTTQRFLILSLALVLFGAGCQGAPTAVTPKAAKSSAPKAEPSSAPDAPAPSTSPSTAASVTPTFDTSVPTTFYGRVIGLDGKPAVGVPIKGYLIGNNGSNVIGNNGSSYRLAQAGAQAALPEALTDNQGVFTLIHPDNVPLTVEAIQSTTVKAIAFQVGSETEGLVMQLAKTGTLTGKVVSAKAGVTNLENVDVFIPGTPYVAKTAANGTYTLNQVPASSFKLVASKLGLGRGELTTVKVEPEKTTTAPDLTLANTPPVLTTITPATGLPGTEVTLTGTHFGATTGEIFSVTFGGATASAPDRIDDQTIKVKVPASAKTGDVVVTVNGIPGAAQPFNVVKSVAIATRRQEILKGKTFAYKAIGKDADDADVENVKVTWKATGSAFKVDADGLVTAENVGTGTLSLETGALKDSLQVDVVDRLATVSTYLGDGTREYADGTAASARFSGPGAMVFDSAGNLYVLDERRIRKITPAGAVSSFSNTTKMYEGSGLTLRNDLITGQLTLNSSDELYVSDDLNGAVVKLDASGNGTVEANMRSLLHGGHPSGVAIDAEGRPYILDARLRNLYKINHLDQIKLFAGGSSPGFVDGTGGLASFNNPQGMVMGPDGALYIADTGNHSIRRSTVDGIVTTVAGDGVAGDADGPAATARFNGPTAVAFDAAGHLLVADTENQRIRMINLTSQQVTTLAGSGAKGFVDDTGKAARFSDPMGVVVGPDGTVIVSDYAGFRLRKIRIETAP